jgi:hypothetical protein
MEKFSRLFPSAGKVCAGFGKDFRWRAWASDTPVEIPANFFRPKTSNLQPKEKG